MAELPQYRGPLARHVARRAATASVLGSLICAFLTVLGTTPAGAVGEPQVTVADITVDEPHAAETGSMDFPVTLAAPSADPLAVPWRLAPGKPTYLPTTLASGTLVFEPGVTEMTLSLPLEFNPTDHTAPYYYTVVISPSWPNYDNYGVATIHDTTRDGEFGCEAAAYLAISAGPVPVPSASSGTVGGTDCRAGFREDQRASFDDGHLTVAGSTMEVEQYADNSVYSQPQAGDGGEAHVRLTGVVWRVAPGLVLRIASLRSDAQITCTALGGLPRMEAASEVRGLSINGAPPLGTITDEHVIDLGGGSRIVLNRHQDQSVVISGGPQAGESHRTLRQVAIEVATNAGLQNAFAYVGSTFIGQLWGNPCAA